MKTILTETVTVLFDLEGFIPVIPQQFAINLIFN